MEGIVLLISFIAGAGAFACGVVAGALLLSKPQRTTDELILTQNTVTLPSDNLTNPPPKRRGDIGAVRRPDVETLEKKDKPLTTAENEEMEKVFDAIVNSPHQTGLHMHKGVTRSMKLEGVYI